MAVGTLEVVMTHKKIIRAKHDPYGGQYPKLVIRLMAACYQYENVPICFQGEEEMVAYAVHKATSSGFRTCLVLGPNRAWYCDPDGSCRLCEQPPRGGLTFSADGRFVDFEPADVPEGEDDLGTDSDGTLN